MGLRPVSYVFGDMETYARVFDVMAMGGDPGISKDYGFYTLMRIIAWTGSKTLFFFIVSFLYVVPLYWASKRFFPRYYFFAFLILVASFSFWAYGTNGLRNGVATSLMILTFSFYDRKLIMYLLFLLSYSFHGSMLLPIAAYFMTLLYRNTPFYFVIWGLSIVLSLVAGGFFENVISSIGILPEDKVLDYFRDKETYEESFAYTGFRWDFLLYSSMAVLIAYYFIFVKKFRDPLYLQLTGIFLLANSFWILVIRASFTNRFAYLSWFMMGLVIIYPYLKKLYWRNQFSVIGLITLLYFSFTFFMNVVLVYL